MILPSAVPPQQAAALSWSSTAVRQHPAGSIEDVSLARGARTGDFETPRKTLCRIAAEAQHGNHPPGIVAYRRRRPGYGRIGISHARLGEAIRFEHRPDEDLFSAENRRQPLPEDGCKPPAGILRHQGGQQDAVRGDEVGQRQVAILEGGRQAVQEFVMQAPRRRRRPDAGPVSQFAHQAAQLGILRPLPSILLPRGNPELDQSACEPAGAQIGAARLPDRVVR